ncbi:MAG: glycosyltransferase [Acetobacteraceae bacterium]
MTKDFLFATWEGGGNVPPTLGAVRRLVARGHRVRVLADDVLREEVAAAGGSFLPWRRAPNRPDRSIATDPLRDWEAEGEGGGLVLLLERLMVGAAAVYAADTLDELRRAPADVVVSSDLLFGPMIAAEATGTRLALFGPNISFVTPIPGVPPVGPGLLPPTTPEEQAQADAVRAWYAAVMASQLPMLNATRATFGLRPLGDTFDQPGMADLALLATSRAFDFPADSLPPAVRYVGPLLDQPHWAGTWVSPWDAEDIRPLVLVALSSTFQNQAATIQAVLDAAAPLPMRVLVTRGPSLAGVPFRLPPNAVAVDTAPHDVVMREASVVVTHCGHGTTMRALAHGRPILCLPMGRDQNDNAARIVARGAGLRLAPDADAASIRAALTALEAELCFTVAASHLGAAIATAEPDNALVEELEALAACPGCAAAA